MTWKKERCQDCKKDISYVPLKNERHHLFCDSCWRKRKERQFEEELSKKLSKNIKSKQWDIKKIRQRERDKFLEDFKWKT